MIRGRVFDHYALVLNKFPTLWGHALLVSGEFSSQSLRLSRRDLDALHRCAVAADALGFYNSDREAGASQPHKHFQIVPFAALERWTSRHGEDALPIASALRDLPREQWRWSSRAPFVPVVRRIPALQRAGIAHAVVALPPRATFAIDFSHYKSHSAALFWFFRRVCKRETRLRWFLFFYFFGPMSVRRLSKDSESSRCFEPFNARRRLSQTKEGARVCLARARA